MARDCEILRNVDPIWMPVPEDAPHTPIDVLQYRCCLGDISPGNDRNSAVVMFVTGTIVEAVPIRRTEIKTGGRRRTNFGNVR